MSAKIKALSCLLLFIILISQSCQDTATSKVHLNSNWRFQLIDISTESDEQFQLTNFNDADWEEVNLPHTARIEPLVVNDQWQGICWYRKEIDVTKAHRNKKVFLEFEAAMNHSKIWMNGTLVSDHHGGYLPVVIDATKYVHPGEKNIIAVRLDNRDNPVTGPKPLKILDFNMYGGLYRNVWLTIKNKVYISHPVLADKTAGGGVFVSFPKVAEKESIVKVKTHFVNEENKAKSIELIHSILFDGNTVKEYHSPELSMEAESDIEHIEEFEIASAKLWSPGNPNLYTLESKVLIDGQLADQETTRFGIREFTFKDNNLYINGEKTYLRGVNRHQEYPFVGYALSDQAQYRDARKIKDAGFNYIRLSHYPQAPAFMDACDELGLIVLDAIMGWQFYSDTDAFLEYCYRSTKELILRDRNRPCILAWEASLNESQMPLEFMEELHSIVHAEYPGENVYSCGWLDEVYDIYLQARQHRLLHDHSENLTKPYVVSEYGDWEYFSQNAGLNQHNYARELRIEKSSRQLRAFGEARLLQQATNIQEAHNDNLSTPAFADSYWVMYDYNRGYDDELEASGIMDIFRLPKFAYHFYRSQQEPEVEVVLNIASYWTPESSTDVRVFSNCDEVELYLNDRLVGRQKPDVNENTGNLQHPPFTFKVQSFTAGSISAIGFIDEKRVAEHLVKTPKKPVHLKIWLDESGKEPTAGSNDVLFLYIAAIDDQRTIVPDYSEVIHVNISGDASIMNVDEVKAEAGIATALIRIGQIGGEIKVVAESGALRMSEYVFVAQPE
jgi:beta-galactosidase